MSCRWLEPSPCSRPRKGRWCERPVAAAGVGPCCPERAPAAVPGGPWSDCTSRGHGIPVGKGLPRSALGGDKGRETGSVGLALAATAPQVPRSGTEVEQLVQSWSQLAAGRLPSRWGPAPVAGLWGAGPVVVVGHEDGSEHGTDDSHTGV